MIRYGATDAEINAYRIGWNAAIHEVRQRGKAVKEKPKNR